MLFRSGVDYAVTLSVSPTLLSMLDDSVLRERAGRHLGRMLTLARMELDRFGDEAPWGPLAHWYRDRMTALVERFETHAGRDVLGLFRALSDAGHLELITCTATHAVLPLVDDPGMRNAQVQVAVAEHHRRFGAPPAGMWLPECGFTPGLDELLARHGVRYTFVDTHALNHARPAAHAGPYLPVVTPAGTAVFARDAEGSSQLYSDTGYSSDPQYREYSRDIGFDRPLSYIRPFIQPSGARVSTGLKYHRATAGDGDREPWSPAAALERARADGAHFASARRDRARDLSEELGRAPVFTLPYEAELFGHLWYEGPLFLEALLREVAGEPHTLVASTPSRVLDSGLPLEVAMPATSSWGEGGAFASWLDESNDWIHRHLLEVRRRLRDVVLPAHAGPMAEVATSAARQALLAHGSDWPFLLKKGAGAGYATRRVEDHLRRFLTLSDMLESGRADRSYIDEVATLDPLFAALDVSHAFDLR